MLALQIPLTDAFIAEELERKSQEPIVQNTIYIIAVLLITVIGVIVCLVKHRKSQQTGEPSPAFGVMILIGAVGIGLLTFLSSMQKVHREAADTASSWYVKSSQITDLEIDEDTRSYRVKRNGRTRRRYYTVTNYSATFAGVSGKGYLSEAEYNSYYIGEELYLVMNSENKIELIYSKDDYEYEGSKLK